MTKKSNPYIPKSFYFCIVLGIKVATGVRRCGKPTLMTQFQDLLCKENGKVSILAINMDMPEICFFAKRQNVSIKPSKNCA